MDERDSPIRLLDGEECPQCGDGDLSPGTYKGGDALLCGACETPVVREL